MRLGAVFALLLLAGPVCAEPAKESFDQPLSIKTVDLEITQSISPPQHAKLTCTYYPAYMVRELDIGEVGDTAIDMTPVKQGAMPPCNRTSLPGEQDLGKHGAVNLGGVKGPYLFLYSGESADGLFGMTILDTRTMKQVFDGEVDMNDVPRLSLAGDTLTMAYLTGYQADCSLPDGGSACRQKIIAATRLDILPDCRNSYDSALHEEASNQCRNTPGNAGCDHVVPTPKQIAEMKADPSVIFYPVTATVTPSGNTVTTVQGSNAVRCAASE